MYAYARKRMLENNDPNRPPYRLLTHSCLQFMKQVAEEGGADMPVVLDPRPDGYIQRVREKISPSRLLPKDRNAFDSVSIENKDAPDSQGGEQTHHLSRG